MRSIGISEHAIRRFREDFSGGDGLTDDEVKALIRDIVSRARKCPRSPVFGVDTRRTSNWFLCVRDKTVVTVMHRHSRRRNRREFRTLDPDWNWIEYK